MDYLITLDINQDNVCFNSRKLIKSNKDNKQSQEINGEYYLIPSDKNTFNIDFNDLLLINNLLFETLNSLN